MEEILPDQSDDVRVECAGLIASLAPRHAATKRWPTRSHLLVCHLFSWACRARSTFSIAAYHPVRECVCDVCVSVCGCAWVCGCVRRIAATAIAAGTSTVGAADCTARCFSGGVGHVGTCGTRGDRQCLDDEIVRNTRQRQWLDHEGSGHTRQQHVSCVSPCPQSPCSQPTRRRRSSPRTVPQPPTGGRRLRETPRSPMSPRKSTETLDDRSAKRPRSPVSPE